MENELSHPERREIEECEVWKDGEDTITIPRYLVNQFSEQIIKPIIAGVEEENLDFNSHEDLAKLTLMVRSSSKLYLGKAFKLLKDSPETEGKDIWILTLKKAEELVVVDYKKDKDVKRLNT